MGKQTGTNLIDVFINALKEEYKVKIYTKGNNYMELILYKGYEPEPLIIGIPNINKFNNLLFYYINALNNYYINIKKSQMDKSLNIYLRELLLGILDEECYDFNAYLEKLTNTLHNSSKKL